MFASSPVMRMSKPASLPQAPCSARLGLSRTVARKPKVCVGMSKGDEPRETSQEKANDSYAKIEAPVRDTIPDRIPTPVSERQWGKDADSPISDLTSDRLNPDKQILGTEVGLVDSFRFIGAVPEVANCRLAMLGFALAVLGELTTGRNVYQQVAAWPKLTAAVFLLIIVATVVPVTRGVPRRGNSFFNSDAEIVNGRLAMIAFTLLCIISFYHGSYTGFVAHGITSFLP